MGEIAAEQKLDSLFYRECDRRKVVPGSEAVALAGHRGDGHTGLAERVDIAINGAHRALTPLREISRAEGDFLAQPRKDQEAAVHLLHGNAKYTLGVGTPSIAERVEDVLRRIASASERSGRSAEEVTLVAVTKSVAADAIREAVEAGVHHLGENRVQEAEAKQPSLADINALVTWHMVGHLQTNKVKTALGLFDIIHSVDSLHLAEAISRRSTKPVPIFLEVNITGEGTKFGFSPAQLNRDGAAIALLPNLEVRGLMTVAPQAANAEDARPHFRRLRDEAERLGLRELSMGMSDDFGVAVEEGATHVRIGRAIFGERR